VVLGWWCSEAVRGRAIVELLLVMVEPEIVVFVHFISVDGRIPLLQFTVNIKKKRLLLANVFE